MIKISLGKAKTQLAKLLEEIEKGEEVVITNKNKPIAKLVPLKQSLAGFKRKLGSAKGKVSIADDFDEPIEDFSPVPVTDKDEILN